MRVRKFKNGVTFFVTDKMYEMMKDTSKTNGKSLGAFLREAVQSALDDNNKTKEANNDNQGLTVKYNSNQN